MPVKTVCVFIWWNTCTWAHVCKPHDLAVYAAHGDLILHVLLLTDVDNDPPVIDSIIENYSFVHSLMPYIIECMLEDNISCITATFE